MVEDARYAATGGKHPETGKNLSRRPDTLARKNMDTANESINRQPVAGHVPGIAIGDRYVPDSVRASPAASQGHAVHRLSYAS